MRLYALFRLAFASTLDHKPFVLPHKATRWLIMQKARCQAVLRHRPSTDCKCTVSGTFHSPFGVLFTFPSRYWFTIGHQGVFSLRRWASQIHAGFHVTRATWVCVPEGRTSFGYRAVTFFGSACPAGIRLEVRFVTFRGTRKTPQTHPSTPHAQRLRPMTCTRFGLFRVRSPLLTESRFAFSSSSYLDVSVRWVGFVRLCIQRTIARVRLAGFPHSDTPG